MRSSVAAVLCVGFVVVAGCASPVKKVDVNKGLDAFYTQQRTVDLLTVRGTNMTVTYTGGRSTGTACD